MRLQKKIMFFLKALLRVVRAIASRLEILVSTVRINLKYGLNASSGARAGPGLRTRITDGGICTVGTCVVIERNTELTAASGKIEIGDNTFIGQGSIIVAKELVSIGSNCLIAEYVSIRDQNHRIVPSALIRTSGFEVREVRIGQNVWIGAKSTILPGVVIGDNAVIGAGSVVTKSVPENVVVAGVPARILRRVFPTDRVSDCC